MKRSFWHPNADIWLSGKLRKGLDKKAEAALEAASSYVNGEVSLEQLGKQLSDIAGYEVRFEKHPYDLVHHIEPHYRVWLDGTKNRPRFAVNFTDGEE
jgi:hypothetical protein